MNDEYDMNDGLLGRVLKVTLESRPELRTGLNEGKGRVKDQSSN